LRLAAERIRLDRMSSRSLELDLIPVGNLVAVALDRQTTDLLRELQVIPGVRAERARAEAPVDAKALDVATLGSILVSLGGAGGAVTALVGVLRGWVTRQAGRKLRVRIGDRELEITGADRDEERALIALFTSVVESG
jgi:Effector Associated Constant Component 1